MRIEDAGTFEARKVHGLGSEAQAAKQEQGVTLARLRLAADDLASGALERLSDAVVPLPDAYWIMERDDADRASVREVRDWLIDEGKVSVAR